MKGLIHTNIVRYYGYEMDREQKNLFNIFMEYMPQGTLSGVSKKFHPLSYENVRYARSYSCKSGLKFFSTFVDFFFCVTWWVFYYYFVNAAKVLKIV